MYKFTHLPNYVTLAYLVYESIRSFFALLKRARGWVRWVDVFTPVVHFSPPSYIVKRIQEVRLFDI